MVLFVLHSSSLRAATQVGSAPCKASSTGAGNSYAPIFSADGRHVAFVSHANNLATNDDLGPNLDLFVRDLVASNTVLVSVSKTGYGGANDDIGLYTLSSNAQVVAFETLANNLAPGDSNRHRDIYVRNLASSVTRLITPGANGPSSNPLISEDGQRVIFESLASNLVTNDFNGTNDIFIHDLATGITELVTLNAAGTASPDGPSHSPSISADGLTVAFVSHATNLVKGVTNTLGEVYARKVAERTTRWAVASHVPRTFASFQGVSTYRASKPSVSRNGEFVSFRTQGAFVRFELQRETNYIRIAYTNRFTLDGIRIDVLEFADNPRVSTQFSPDTLLKEFALSKLFQDLDSRLLIYPELISWDQTFTGEVPFLAKLQWDSLATNIILTSIPAPSGALIKSYITNIAPTVSRIWTNSFGLSGAPLWTNASWLGSDQECRRIAVIGEIPINLVNPEYSSPRRTQLVSIDLSDGSLQFLCTNGSSLNGINLSASVPALHSVSGLVWDCTDPTLTPDDLNGSSDIFVRNVDTGETTLVSARHTNTPSNTGSAMTALNSNYAALSGDGSRLVFTSLDSTLIPNDTNHWPDVVVRNLSAGTNIDVSRSSGVIPNLSLTNIPGTNIAVGASLSADGRRVAFAAEQLRESTSFTNRRVYFRNLELDVNRTIQAGSTVSHPTFSQDGRFVAFHDTAQLNNVIDFNNAADVFIYSADFAPVQDNRTINPFPVSTTGVLNSPTANGHSVNPVFGPDSTWIVFESLATDLTTDPNTTPGRYQLFARQFVTDQTNIANSPLRLISYSTSASTNLSGTSIEFPLPGGGENPHFAADGRTIFFQSATNLIYRHNLSARYITNLTEFEGGIYTNIARPTNQLVCTGCANPSPSSEGRYVAYESRPAPGGVTNILLKDLESGTVELVSVSLNGTNGNGSSISPLLSHDARFVVFASRASDLVPGDNNRATDIFVRDRWAGATHCLSRNLAGNGTGNRVSSNPILSADGRTVAFQSFASDLVAGDYNDTRDVFVVTLGGPDNDRDGMEDDWELAYFNTLDRDGSGDFDNDGASDRDEFRAGTNPSNNASILRVLRLTTSISAGTSAPRTTVILWNAVPGKTYRVETKVDLNAPWTSVGSDVTAGSTSASATHALTGNEGFATAQSFYRVTLVQ